MRINIEINHIPMSSITERRVGAHLTITELIITTLIHIEIDRSVSGRQFIAQTVTPRICKGNSARTEPVHLSFFEIHVIRVETVIQRDGGRSVFSLHVRNCFRDWHSLLSWEICDIVWLRISLFRIWFADGGRRSVRIFGIWVMSRVSEWYSFEVLCLLNNVLHYLLNLLK